MSERGPTVTVYRNRKTGEFRVQPHARYFGTPQEFGLPTVLSSDAPDIQLLTAVLENLPKTESQKYDLSLAPKHSTEERRRRLKEDQPIDVCQLIGGYELAPFVKIRNSFGSVEEMTRVIPIDEFLSKGAEILRQLFRDMP